MASIYCFRKFYFSNKIEIESFLFMSLNPNKSLDLKLVRLAGFRYNNKEAYDKPRTSLNRFCKFFEYTQYFFLKFQYRTKIFSNLKLDIYIFDLPGEQHSRTVYLSMVLGGDGSPLHLLCSVCLGRYPISYIPL